MKAKKEFAILFFIIAVLLFYIYSERGDKTHYALPEIQLIQSDTISEIHIRKEDSLISLVREGDKWLAGEKKYRADKVLVENMLKEISALTLTALASESENYSLYDLDEKGRIEVSVYKGDMVLRTVNIGKPASSYRYTFVMIDDDHRVYHAEGNLRNEFDKKISDLRDKTLMAFNDDISEVVLKKGREEMTIVKAAAPVSVDAAENEAGTSKPGESGPKWTTVDGKAVKEGEIDSLVSALSNFQCDAFIEDRTKEEFKAPIYTLILKGATTYTISVFEKKESQHAAVSSESEYPCLLSEWKANQIMKDFKSLLEEGT